MHVCMYLCIYICTYLSKNGSISVFCFKTVYSCCCCCCCCCRCFGYRGKWFPGFHQPSASASNLVLIDGNAATTKSINQSMPESFQLLSVPLSTYWLITQWPEKGTEGGGDGGGGGSGEDGGRVGCGGSESECGRGGGCCGVDGEGRR